MSERDAAQDSEGCQTARAERAEAERDLLGGAVEAAAEAVAVADAQGRVVYVNPAYGRLLGLEREALIGHRLELLAALEADDPRGRSMRAALERRGSWQGKRRLKRPDGGLVFEECSLTRVNRADGALLGHIAVRRDVTEQRRLEQAAAAAVTGDNLGWAISGLRHELGNPINAVSSTLALLADRFTRQGEERAAHYLQRCQDELARVRLLLDGMNSFGQFERPEPRELDLPAFLDQLEHLMRADLQRLGVVLRIEVAPEARHCLADPRALQQVMLNAVKNALDALEGRPEPRITILVARPSEMVLIRVADNGPGMGPKQLEKLFRPFHTTKKTGTGLGLTISQRLMERMDGYIELDSIESEGTWVDLYLPAE
jgi:PAS domain S-box-containing protein